MFKGLGCFSTPPQIITDDDYRDKTISLFESDIRIFVYNIDKFNKEGANMKKVNEVIGDSFYQYLSNLPDLVLIMDESHHYRAEKGEQALNELNPLSKAIEDGYTRTPFAVTRSDIDFYNFGDEQLDKMMLLDGITCHESTKRKLEVYAANHGKHLVKPFMLVVCKDTDHAAWVKSFIKSDEFRNGAYRNKTIIVHSKQKGSETEANTRLLLDVENPDNSFSAIWKSEHGGKHRYAYKNTVNYHDNFALSSLYWISRDLYDSFEDSPNPQLALYVNEAELYDLTMQLMYIVREVIICLTLCVYAEEKSREKENGDKLVMPMPLMEYDDNWKI